MKTGFVTDIHEDIVNLERALTILNEAGCEQIICLGDIVGFAVPFNKNISTRDADGCVRMIAKSAAYCVTGNHDLFAIRKVPVHKAGFDYGNDWYSLDYDKRSRLARNKIWLYEDSELPCFLSNESVAFLNSLEETAIVSAGELPIFISHFCFPDFSGSSINFPAEGFHLRGHFAHCADRNCRVSFSGHGHPEGCLISNAERISLAGFGRHTLPDEPLWIVAPATARTGRKNGVMIYDPEKRQVNVLPIPQ